MRDHFLWVTNLAQRDQLLILPILFATLITLYVDIAFARNMKQHTVLYIVLPLLIATGRRSVRALISIWLRGTPALQRLVAGGPDRLRRMWKQFRLRRIVALDEPQRLAEYGNGLSTCPMRAGYAVPYGPC